MKVRNLLGKIQRLFRKGKLKSGSYVTIHVCFGGNAIEWRDEGVEVECFGPEGDGLQINVDATGSGLLYKDEYTPITPCPYKKDDYLESDRYHGWNEGYLACLKDLGYECKEDTE